MGLAKPEIRPLTDTEIAQLESALGKPVDRDYLVYWVSQAIRDVVKLSTLPSRREYRDELSQIARQGRRWVQHLEQSRSASVLPKTLKLERVISSVTTFCERVESVAAHAESLIGPGRHRIPFALEIFLNHLIGVAKRAQVLPSTPSRALRSQTAPRRPPPFFEFVTEALDIAIEVVKSSSLPKTEMNAVLSVLASRTDPNLTKILERLRGQISNYQPSAHGLVEWPVKR
jgi:hypothetical protein